MAGGAAGARVQPNMYPAKYSFSATSTSCTDFVVYPTGTQGAAGAASIVAFTKLYAGTGTGSCIATGANAPVDWAYNTGGMATTSPVLSGDGTQVAFIQVSSGGVASLVVLKPLAGDTGTPTLPVTLASQASGAAYQTCVAPCMYTMLAMARTTRFRPRSIRTTTTASSWATIAATCTSLRVCSPELRQ